MLFSTKFAGLLGFLSLVPVATVLAAPLGRRAAADKAAATDGLVLQFALVLENLEADFYKQALAKFPDAELESAGFLSGAAATQAISKIQSDEAAHVTLLAGAIKASGAKAISDSCKFDFGSALKDVPTFLATARTLEVTGVAAYLGAAALVSDKGILETAGSILTVEGRHQTSLNLLSGTTSIPSAFDLAMTPPQVLAVASSFISGCDLGIKPNTPLSIASDKPGQALLATTKVNLKAAGAGSTSKLFCQMLVGGQATGLVQPADNCLVPPNVNGPVFVYLTDNDTPLDVNVATQKSTAIKAGPAVVFVDSVPDKLSALVLKSGSVSSGPSDSKPSSGSGSVDMSTLKGGNGLGKDGNSSSGTTIGIGAQVDGFDQKPVKDAKAGPEPLKGGSSGSMMKNWFLGGQGRGSKGDVKTCKGNKIGAGATVQGFKTVSASSVNVKTSSKSDSSSSESSYSPSAYGKRGNRKIGSRRAYGREE